MSPIELLPAQEEIEQISTVQPLSLTELSTARDRIQETALTQPSLALDELLRISQGLPAGTLADACTILNMLDKVYQLMILSLLRVRASASYDAACDFFNHWVRHFRPKPQRLKLDHHQKKSINAHATSRCA